MQCMEIIAGIIYVFYGNGTCSVLKLEILYTF